MQETFPNSRKVTDFDNHPVITQGYRVVGSKGNDHRVGQSSVFGERKYVTPWNQSIAQRLWNSFTDATHLTSPPTYQDGYGRTLNAENSFWKGAEGNELSRMGKTALGTGTIIGLGFLPQSFTVAPTATVGAFGLGLGADFLAGKAMDGIEKNVLNRSGLKFSDNQKFAVRLAAGLYGGSKGYKLGKWLSTPDAPIVYEPRVHQNDYINAPGNAMEPVMVDPRVASIYNQQINGKFASHNPSRLTKAELEGWSKHDRTNVYKPANETIKQLHTPVEWRPSPDDYWDARTNMPSQHMSRAEAVKRMKELGLTDYTAINMHDFVKTLPDEVNPLFAPMKASDGSLRQNPYITFFREGKIKTHPMSHVLSDDDIAKFLTYYDNQLLETSTGQLKDVMLWHASPKKFDIFDYTKFLGSTRGNTGFYGPGNYFSTHIPIEHFSGISGGYNFQGVRPFRISGIEQTIPSDIVAGKPGFNIGFTPISDGIPIHKSGNIAIVGSNTSGPGYLFKPYVPSNFHNTSVQEVVVPRNTGIKTLFADPSRFVRNADGSVSFTPVDWNDPRVDFKNGGKLNNIRHK